MPANLLKKLQHRYFYIFFFQNTCGRLFLKVICENLPLTFIILKSPIGRPPSPILNANTSLVRLWTQASKYTAFRGGSKTAATSNMELFLIIVHGFQPQTIVIKCSILDVAAVLDPPLVSLDLRLIHVQQESLFL